MSSDAHRHPRAHTPPSPPSEPVWHPEVLCGPSVRALGVTSPRLGHIQIQSQELRTSPAQAPTWPRELGTAYPRPEPGQRADSGVRLVQCDRQACGQRGMVPRGMGSCFQNDPTSAVLPPFSAPAPAGPSQPSISDPGAGGPTSTDISTSASWAVSCGLLYKVLRPLELFIIHKW